MYRTPQEQKWFALEQWIDMEPYDALISYAGLNDEVLDWIARENDLDFDDMIDDDDDDDDDN